MNAHLIAYGAMACWFVALWLRQRAGGPAFVREQAITRIQALQPCVQLTILTYWAVYWPELRTHAGWITLHIGFAYLADAAFAWTLGRTWRITLGIFPVVFSTNLFLYYADHNMLYAYLLYLVAFAGKALIRWKDGGHIFNPSSLGMSVMLLAAAFLPRWFPHPIDVDHAFLLPPNIIEVLFLISMIGQMRIRVIFTTLGAALTLLSGAFHVGSAHVSLFYPASFIAVLLLVTDPRTSPRSAVGQLLYGATYAASYQLLSDGFTELWGHDGGAKVLGVLPANLTVPFWDRIGRQVDARLGAIVSMRFNPSWVALWALLVFGLWGLQPERKQGFFDLWVPDHEKGQNPWIQHDAEGRVTCEANPVFCRPFSLSREVRMWWQGPPPP